MIHIMLYSYHMEFDKISITEYLILHLLFAQSKFYIKIESSKNKAAVEMFYNWIYSDLWKYLNTYYKKFLQT